MGGELETKSGHAGQERLKAIRGEIDAVDRELLRLLNVRAALSREVGQIKAQNTGLIFQPLRERDLLDRLVQQNPGQLPNEHLAAIWREILSSSRALQRPQNVAYLGPEGTFSYFAGVEYLGRSARFQPCKDIAQIFEKVSQGDCELGVVPLENSLQGTVGVSFDLFLKHPVVIEAELYSRISHCLLSNAQSLTSIRKVYSHPQPLAQCGRWLRMHLPNTALIPAESTAAAATMAAADRDSAAIGNCRLAPMLCLDILARSIEDEPGNWTRFVIIAAQNENKYKTSQEADKTSLLFTLADRPGSLAEVLDLMAKNKVNMRKLESRPLSGQPWRYVFFCDVESDLTSSEHAGLLEQLALTCSSFRILGSYPAGPQLERITAGPESQKENEQ